VGQRASQKRLLSRAPPRSKSTPETAVVRLLRKTTFGSAPATERVSAFLARYDERDAAINQLINGVLLSRRQLVGELREHLLRPAAPLFAHSPS
jgi:hypothetical protein